METVRVPIYILYAITNATHSWGSLIWYTNQTQVTPPRAIDIDFHGDYLVASVILNSQVDPSQASNQLRCGLLMIWLVIKNS